MELPERLKKAAAIVEEAELPPEFRAAAFQKVLEELPPATEGERAPSETRRPKMRLLAIAQRIEVPLEEVEEVYFEEGEDLGIAVASSRIDPSKAGGTKQLALLVAGGRQAAGLDDEWTPSSEIRRWCHEFGRFDNANFAGALLEMQDLFQTRGSGRSREVKLRRVAFERLAALVRRLAATAQRDEGRG